MRTGPEDKTEVQELNQGDVHLFFSLNYKDYYSVVVRKLSQADQVNLDFFHWKNTHDLIYTGINVQMVKAF
jgi:hypothetical protein